MVERCAVANVLFVLETVNSAVLVFALLYKF